MFAPHYRLSLIGTLSGSEVFQMNLSMIEHDSGVIPVLGDLVNHFDDVILDGGYWADLVSDCTTFFEDARTQIVNSARLKRVKVAVIDADGHYARPPKEEAVDVAGGVSVSSYGSFPNQVSRKVTLETDADLGRVKGGFYIPGCSPNGWDNTTQLYSVGITEGVRDSVADFIENLENAPGIDVSDVQVVVASQGRHNMDGSVRLAPGNHDVQRVNVGRRADIQRRRANKISEARIADASVT